MCCAALPSLPASLEELWCSNNSLAELGDAPWFSALTQLQVLDLNRTNITRLPQPMAALHALRELYLELCPFLHIDEAKLQAELPSCRIHYSPYTAAVEYDQ